MHGYWCSYLLFCYFAHYQVVIRGGTIGTIQIIVDAGAIHAIAAKTLCFKVHDRHL